VTEPIAGQDVECYGVFAVVKVFRFVGRAFDAPDFVVVTVAFAAEKTVLILTVDVNVIFAAN
jgi:hypothetical protein